MHAVLFGHQSVYFGQLTRKFISIEMKVMDCEWPEPSEYKDRRLRINSSSSNEKQTLREISKGS